MEETFKPLTGLALNMISRWSQAHKDPEVRRNVALLVEQVQHTNSILRALLEGQKAVTAF